MIDRGDIRWFRFEAPDKRRPVLVLGRDDVLPMLTQIPVIPISTQIRGLRWEVRLSAADGLPSDCVLKPEWIKAVDRAALGPWIATFPGARWNEVTAALLDVLGLEAAART
jgi:mRNA interferase MazF